MEPLPKEKEAAIEHAVTGYRQLVEMLTASRTPEFPDPGVTMAQMRVLMLLDVVGESRMSDLAPQLGISASTLSSLVERLVESDLAQRHEDARDRRIVRVSLTPMGHGLIETFQELGSEHLRALLTQLDDAELEIVNQAVDLLVVAAHRMNPEDKK